MSPFAAAAAVYARLGLHVFPLRPRSKEPWTKHGFLDATTDEKAIASWARRCRDANVGIALAASGLVAIDEDRRDRGDETLEDLEARLGLLPSTWTVLTKDGQHLYYRAPAGMSFVGKAGPGVDVKHEGYVVAPPSVHPSGHVYRWEATSRFDEAPLAELPREWLAALTGRRTRDARPSSGVDARESYLGVCFEAMGWLGPVLHDGRRIVRCPWAHEHTDDRGTGDDTSTVIFPKAVGATMGGFRCLHGHCARRTWRDVVNLIPIHVRGAAARATQPERNRVLRAASASQEIHGAA
jgi:hypothetical protein